MVEREVTVVNRLGLHARAAARLVALASEFECEVRLVRDGREVNAKSIMGVMMLAAARGTRLRIVCRGPDEGEAVERLAALVADGFGEE